MASLSVSMWSCAAAAMDSGTCPFGRPFLDVEAVDRHVLDNSSAHAQVNPLCQRIVFAERLQDLQVANRTSIESPLILVTLLSKRRWYHSWRPCPGQSCVGIHILVEIIGTGKGEVSMTHTRENTDMPAIHNRSDIMEPMELVTAMLLRDARLSGNLFSNTRWMIAGRHVLEEVASRCLETPSLVLSVRTQRQAAVTGPIHYW